MRLVHAVERAAPARVGEEVDCDVGNPGHLTSQALLVLLIFGSLERPVVEERAADDVLARDEAPEARIEAGVSMIAHHEVLIGRHDEVAVLNMVGEIDYPRGDGTM